MQQEFRSCFPDEITVTGVPGIVEPTIVSADCIAPSADNPAANVVAGYPGPSIRHEEIETDFLCAGDPGSIYPACP